MPKFEIALYNEEVRKLVKMGDSHELYEDSWADTHYIDVTAPAEDMARAKIQKQYPSNRGFIIVEITQEKPEDEF
ncbi:MAG: hypothetical protein GY869_32375 [Planctomycetes bacterium]|nr:hypothetical protein [Planctomycetota bacterium]